MIKFSYCGRKIKYGQEFFNIPETEINICCDLCWRLFSQSLYDEFRAVDNKIQELSIYYKKYSIGIKRGWVEKIIPLKSIDDEKLKLAIENINRNEIEFCKNKIKEGVSK